MKMISRYKIGQRSIEIVLEEPDIAEFRTEYKSVKYNAEKFYRAALEMGALIAAGKTAEIATYQASGYNYLAYARDDYAELLDISCRYSHIIYAAETALALSRWKKKKELDKGISDRETASQLVLGPSQPKHLTDSIDVLVI